MPECSYREWLEPYHDGELPAERRAQVEEHLRVCAACAAGLEELRALSRLLGGAPAPAMPRGMVERLHRAVRPERERAVILVCRAASLAAAALLLACGSGLWRFGQGEASASALPDSWEVAAVAVDAAPTLTTANETLTLWIVSDLSQEEKL